MGSAGWDDRGVTTPPLTRSDVSIILPHPRDLRPSRIAGYLAGEGIAYHTVAIDRGEPYAYAQLLIELWAGRRSVVIVEHDVIPTITQVIKLVTCRQSWCYVPYPMGGASDGPALGCTRIGGDLMAAYPTLATGALTLDRARERLAHWTSVDGLLGAAIIGRGITAHRHPGRALHTHTYPQPATR